MPRRGSLRLETAAWLATALTLASTVLGAAALYGHELHKSADRIRKQHAATIARVYASQAVAAAQAGQAEAMESWLRNLATPRSVLLVGVVDTENEPVAVRGSRQMFEQFLPSVESVTDLRQPLTMAQCSSEAFPAPDVLMAAIPLIPDSAAAPIGRLICIIRAPDSELILGRIGRFFILLGLVALTGLVLAVAWFRHAVLRPLTKLSRRSGRGAGSLRSQRQDEIGEVAGVIADLRRSLEQSNLRASHLQKTLRDRVAEETHDITRELRRVERRAWIDPLTRLGNRQLFEDRFDQLFQSQRAAGGDLSVIMLDVDYFKTLNDTLGHQAGDDLLKFIGELLNQFIRDDDLAIRMGGDEFLIVLPAVSADNALAIAERTIRLFAQNARLLDVHPAPTMSGGVASLQRHNPATPAELLQAADAALYESKRAGKSQVSILSNTASLATAR